MNKTIKLAVAGAVLSAASIANAGIIIPAGEWTLDVNGNVNTFAIMDNRDNTAIINGGVASTTGGVNNGLAEDQTSINSGLLPAWLGFTGTTRQNDLDVSFTISFQPGTSSSAGALGGGNAANAATENRQAFITFGDKSWGTVKAGKDLGIFGSDAILSDMTLLGVGASGLGLVGFQEVIGNGSTTTLGHIGTGYLYADWKGQIAYTTPNMNGFQATVGIMQPWTPTNTSANSIGGLLGAAIPTSQESFGYEAKASYTMDMGKVWVGYIQQDIDLTAAIDNDATAVEIGATVNFGNASFTGYYSSGEGQGTTGFLMDGFDINGNARDADTAFVQATYVIPTGTKIGASYGRSDLDATATDAANATINLVSRNEMWTIGAYHPLTKHLNLVAEYNDVTTESMNATAVDNESDSFSVGAILFF